MESDRAYEKPSVSDSRGLDDKHGKQDERLKSHLLVIEEVWIRRNRND